MCKAVAKKGVDIEFIVPYTADHSDIDFMNVRPGIPINVSQVQQGGTAYQSYNFRHIYEDGSHEDLNLYEQTHRYVKAIEGVALLGQFDIIHAHDWLTFRAGIRAKELSGKPLVAHVHATEFDRSGGVSGNPIVHEIEYLGLVMADRIFAVSQLTKNIICQKYDIPADKVEVVHNSIEVDHYEQLDPDNAYGYLTKMKQQGYRVVANIGRLTVQKGLYNLLLSAKEVIARRPKTLFLIVGSGEQYIELLQLSAELGIASNVIFTDFQRGKNLRDAFAIADLFVMPSISEPFGLTPLEAIGYGTPTLISYQSGVAEILQNALKVDFWDVHEMANQIYAVVEHDCLRDELHTQSYKEFAKMSWDNTADKLVSAYHQHAQLVGAR
jgi:glycosyltransferase involved in cell wall biosynthesis